MKKNTKQVRCAVYTRKSTDEGLEKDFNTLDAQREAAEAYIASQKHEGWTCLPHLYDDGGYSGGTIERPAFQQLMADVESNRIDCIVVYKIDRLSRSLMDFSRIMEVLERRGVSLVSVTQQFNTTSSMGRLTLNILLSFAQFEREIISERTRDKMTAARRKGKWTGGHPVLGYDVDPNGGRLLINEREAKQLRAIFRIYLKEGTLQRAVEVIRERELKTKRFKTRTGVWRGGIKIDKTTLHNILCNVLYLGKMKCKDEIVEGEHPAIIDQDTFQQVQRMLHANRTSGGIHIRNKSGALLKGIVRCKHCGCGMTHHFTTRGNRRYRYYVCIKAQKEGWSKCLAPSLPARELEDFVIEQIRVLGRDKKVLKETLTAAQEHLQEEISVLEEQRRQINQGIRSIGREIGELGARVGLDDDATRRLGQMQDSLRSKQQETRQIDERIAIMQARLLKPDELAGAVESFDPVWESLSPTEKATLVHLLVDRVEYDARNESIALSYHPTGIHTLIEENELCQSS